MERRAFSSPVVDKNRTADAEMEAELQGLQAGEERKGSNASQVVDCCLETMLEQIFALGADQTMSKFEVVCQVFFTRIETRSVQMPGRTQELFREGAIKRKDGEFRERRRKGSGRNEGRRERRKTKCKNSAWTRWWSKIGKSFVCAFTRKRKEEEEEQKCIGRVRYSKATQGLGRLGRWLLLLILLGRSMSGVNAAAVGSQREAAVVLRMRGEMQFKEKRQTESVYR